MHTIAHLGPSPLDVLVVGAGQSGLSLAWHLARHGTRYLLVDSAPEIGDSWRHRWDSLRLFTPSQFDALPGRPFPAPADTYPGKDAVADYLHGYAEDHAFPVLTGTRVERLTPDGDGFTAYTGQGAIRARQVVVATGAFHTPYVPAAGAGFDDGVPAVHSAAYRNPAQLPAGRTLVVGAGNSGLQIAAELAATRPVTVSCGSRPPALPQRIAGRDLFWWLTRTGLLHRPADSRVARRLRARGDVVIGSSHRRLRRAGVDFRPRLTGAADHVARFADDSTADVAAVVWATGYRPDYSWVDAPVTDDEGRPCHDRGRSPVPGLWFLGLPWQTGRGSSLLGFVRHDAERLAADLLAADAGAQARPPAALPR